MLCLIGQGRPQTPETAHAGCTDSTAQPLPHVLEALTRHVSPQQVQEVLRQTKRESLRIRKLPAPAMVWLVLMMGLRSDLDIPAMWRQVVGVLCWLLLTLAGQKSPCKSAFSEARRRLGPRPLRRLLLMTGQPIATAQTRGASYKGMPLKAMDGDQYKVPDTPANARAFGRPTTKRNGQPLPGGYPLLQLCRLIEVGTHICVEAIVKPYKASECKSAPKLLSAARSGDLLLWDNGFYSFALMQQAQREGKFFLGSVPSCVLLKAVQKLSDGSYLAKIYPTPRHRQHDSGGMLVRVLEYTFDDPARPGHGERHRLITNLLDESRYPICELIVLYHERWEIEIDNDEITTHQLDRAVELRSRTPAGLVQEMYGVLIAHNAIRALMHESALSSDVDPRQLSFMHAVRVIRDVILVMRNASTGSLPMLYQAMLAAIALGRLAPRDNRINPRVVKVLRPSKFPVKKPKHCNMPQPKKTFVDSIVLLN